MECARQRKLAPRFWLSLAQGPAASAAPANDAPVTTAAGFWGRAIAAAIRDERIKHWLESDASAAHKFAVVDDVSASEAIEARKVAAAIFVAGARGSSRCDSLILATQLELTSLCLKKQLGAVIDLHLQQTNKRTTNTKLQQRFPHPHP